MKVNNYILMGKPQISCLFFFAELKFQLRLNFPVIITKCLDFVVLGPHTPSCFIFLFL